MTSSNPFMKRLSAAPKNSHGKISEKRLAGKLGARLTPASGAMKGAKGDFKKQAGTVKFHMEAKSTVNLTLPLDIGWLVKAQHEALASGATPAITLSFVTPEGKARKSGEWVAVPLEYFHELMEQLEHGNNMA